MVGFADGYDRLCALLQCAAAAVRCRCLKRVVEKMRFSDDFLRSVEENNDIVSLAGSYVQLKRTGNTYSCCCPFHSEKTPSCHFYPNTNSFYCFGCHMGGSVVTFVKEIEHLDFMDAVKFLA